jgi:hypothetical protein
MTKNRLAPILAVLLAIAPAAFATNGYFLHGIGTSSKAMAGATTALPQERWTPTRIPRPACSSSADARSRSRCSAPIASTRSPAIRPVIPRRSA